jgi:Protein of unknown function (DUF4230)
VTSTPIDVRPRSLFARSFGKWLAVAFAAFLFISAGIGILPTLWRHFNPLATKTVDRSQPALLDAITSIADFRAASAQLNVVVDIEKDAKWLPSVVRGERTVLLATGHVDAGVDLSGLDASALNVDSTGQRVKIVLPPARLRTPELDLENSRMLVNKRGVLDRLGSAFGDAPGGERRALELAQGKLELAAQQSNVLAVAETNTAAMITGLVKGLGYTDVTVTFGVPAIEGADAAATEANEG